MDSATLEDWIAALLREAGAFAAAAAAPHTPPPQAGAATRTLTFLLDEAAKLLDKARAALAAETPPAAAEPPLPGKGVLETIEIALAQVLRNPDGFAERYAAFAGEVLQILRDDSGIAPPPGDFRFKDPLWLESRFLRVLLQIYLAWCRAMQGWLGEQPIDEADRRRIEFLIRQWLAAFAPSNLPLNPSALKRAERTNGESVVDGIANWMADVVDNQAMPRQIRPGAYRVGKDFAVSEGSVVHRSEQLELIQYKPLTAQVRRRPVLIVPPQINKYYGFDLRPANSIVRHMLLSGLQVFMLSWRNPTEAHAAWNLETYVQAMLAAADAVSAITRSATLGLVSGCAGALTTMAMLGYLAQTGDRRFVHQSLLVTCILPDKGSEAELFATREAMELSRAYVRAQGVMRGEELAKAFLWLRPNELVWRYWINNYLLGKTPPSLDVLFWDSDSTRLPAGLHSDFLDIYANDVFQRPGALRLFGRVIDFRKLKIDSYFVGGEDDYLMPWTGCYDTCQLLRGRHEFVLSTSGHLQSLLRPPHLGNMIYYTNSDLTLDAAAWRRGAVRNDGTWWHHWHDWLGRRSGALKRAPGVLGAARFPPLEPAPGLYVHE